MMGERQLQKRSLSKYVLLVALFSLGIAGCNNVYDQRKNDTEKETDVYMPTSKEECQRMSPTLEKYCPALKGVEPIFSSPLPSIRQETAEVARDGKIGIPGCSWMIIEGEIIEGNVVNQEQAKSLGIYMRFHASKEKARDTFTESKSLAKVSAESLGNVVTEILESQYGVTSMFMNPGYAKKTKSLSFTGYQENKVITIEQFFPEDAQPLCDDQGIKLLLSSSMR